MLDTPMNYFLLTKGALPYSPVAHWKSIPVMIYSYKGSIRGSLSPNFMAQQIPPRTLHWPSSCPMKKRIFIKPLISLTSKGQQSELVLVWVSAGYPADFPSLKAFDHMQIHQSSSAVAEERNMNEAYWARYSSQNHSAWVLILIISKSIIQAVLALSGI